jgi:pyridoxamine 5'-phosphate oxidase
VLEEADLSPNPLLQLKQWLEEARQQGIEEPNAAALATASSTGIPSNRMILVKSISERGITLFTNHESRKGREMEANEWVSLVFYWKELERQAVIDGRATQLDRADSEEYFRQRPLRSQLATWASHQGNPIASREELERAYEIAAKKFAGQEVPMPLYWGGYLIAPERIEFWQGREGRCHDRINYRAVDEGWHTERLSP